LEKLTNESHLRKSLILFSSSSGLRPPSPSISWEKAGMRERILNEKRKITPNAEFPD
jgi:hypothetical protein